MTKFVRVTASGCRMGLTVGQDRCNCEIHKNAAHVFPLIRAISVNCSTEGSDQSTPRVSIVLVLWLAARRSGSAALNGKTDPSHKRNTWMRVQTHAPSSQPHWSAYGRSLQSLHKMIWFRIWKYEKYSRRSDHIPVQAANAKSDISGSPIGGKKSLSAVHRFMPCFPKGKKHAGRVHLFTSPCRRRAGGISVSIIKMLSADIIDFDFQTEGRLPSDKPLTAKEACAETEASCRWM